MKKEFISSNGKVILENGILYIRNFKHSFWNGIPGKLIVPLLVPVVLILNLLSADSAFDYFFSIVLVVVYSRFFLNLYDGLFKRSFSHRIPLHRIHHIELMPDDLGLETIMVIRLKNGRYRPVPFRNLEKQFEPLAELITSHTTELQPA